MLGNKRSFLRLFCSLIVVIYGCSQKLHTANRALTQCQPVYNKKFKADVYQNTDVFPEYPGGEQALLAFILKNIQYPEAINLQGSVSLKLWIDTEGYVKDLKIIHKQPQNDLVLEREFLRVFKLMPRWAPGQCAGKCVYTEMPFVMRISFQD